jgi:hypothetical protein
VHPDPAARDHVESGDRRLPHVDAGWHARRSDERGPSRLDAGSDPHLPHLIAYTIVGTATDVEDSLKSEVIDFSASDFRDFTRIAASDPVMWRDVFLNNREALQELFTRTRAIRRSIIEAKQA